MPATDRVQVLTPGAFPAGAGPGGVSRRQRLFDSAILAQAAIDAMRKFDPRAQVRNPVMFVVLIGTVVTLIESIAHPSVFSWLVTVWLALTVAFSNFAEALAEGRGKAQAETLRRMRTDTEARRIRPDGTEERIPAAAPISRRPGRLRGGRRHPVRRGDHRGRRRCRRVGDHR
jgi:potassium-transporting ATPase ATP-binding subunit